jgi:hypothetical protein
MGNVAKCKQHRNKECNRRAAFYWMKSHEVAMLGERLGQIKQFSPFLSASIESRGDPVQHRVFAPIWRLCVHFGATVGYSVAYRVNSQRHG